MNVDRVDAATWATWFRALGDPTRIVILNLVATAGRPMSVAEIVDAVDVGQSTVSHHLKILGDVRFLLVDREGTSSLWRINENCIDCFPTAAELVMGRAPTAAQWETLTCSPVPKQPTRKATR
jgi:DNA-binding transcriptional ArsR family regulator